MMKNETIVSDRKCAPAAILATDTTLPNRTAATKTTRRRRPNA
jgi:hypothetical protein